MKIEYISRICFTARRAFQKQRQRSVRYSMLGQIVIDDQHIFSLMHKIFRHCSSCVGGNILQRSRIAGCRRHHHRIIQCILIFQSINQLCNCRCLLSYSNIDTDYILSFLIDNSIQRNGCFPSLTVTDNQLSLPPANREHGINSKNTRFHWNTYRFSFHYSGSLPLYRIIILFFYRTKTVYSITERIDDTA